MIVVSLIFAGLLAFVILYFVAFERSRYNFAKMIAGGLGGEAVFRIGRSYMKRFHGEVEERVWIVPDQHKAWGSIWSIFTSTAKVLCLFRAVDPGLRFYIEPKAGALFRSISLGGLKKAAFNIPGLDEALDLRANDPVEAMTYFLQTERHRAVLALFEAGFTRIRTDRGGIEAAMDEVPDKDLAPERLDSYLKHMRAL